MKILLKAAVVLTGLIATTAHAAVPALVTAAVEGCCAIDAACCLTGSC